MKVSTGGFFYKLLGVIRFIMVCFFYMSKNTDLFGVIGRGNLLYFKGDIRIGKRLITGKNVDLINEGILNTGESVSRVVSKGCIKIGSNVILAHFVSILDHDYTVINKEIKFDGYTINSIEIENNVIVVTNSVVTKSMPDSCIVASILAVIKRSI